MCQKPLKILRTKRGVWLSHRVTFTCPEPHHLLFGQGSQRPPHPHSCYCSFSEALTLHIMWASISLNSGCVLYLTPISDITSTIRLTPFLDESSLNWPLLAFLIRVFSFDFISKIWPSLSRDWGHTLLHFSHDTELAVITELIIPHTH